MKHFLSLLIALIVVSCSNTRTVGTLQPQDFAKEGPIRSNLENDLSRHVILNRSFMGTEQAKLTVIPKTMSYLRLWADVRTERKNLSGNPTDFDREFSVLFEKNYKRQSCFIVKVSANGDENQKYLNLNKWRFYVQSPGIKNIMFKASNSQVQRDPASQKTERISFPCVEKFVLQRGFKVIAISDITKEYFVLEWKAPKE